MKPLSIHTLPTLALLAALSAPALAHPPESGRPWGRMDPAEMRQRLDGRLAELKPKLELTPSQEPAWAAWVAALQPPAQRPQHPSRQQLASLTTPERLDYVQAMQAERAAALARRADATRAFYAVLTPQQRTVFDAETARLLPGPRHGGPMRHNG